MAQLPLAPTTVGDALCSNPPSSGLASSGRGWSGFMQACRADGMHSLSVFSDVLSQLESGHRGDIYTMEICNCCQSAPSFFKGARWYTSHNWPPARSGALRGGKGATGFFVFTPKRARGSDRGRKDLSPLTREPGRFFSLTEHQHQAGCHEPTDGFSPDPSPEPECGVGCPEEHRLC